MARAGLGLGAQELADLAGVSYPSLNRFEGGASVRSETVDLIKEALAKAGAKFAGDAERVEASVPR